VNFTSGTTAMPKLVEHTHSSYPIGHLSTMYWIGLQPVTYTSMCRAPVGRSTPGRVFSPPGLPVPRCAFSTTYVSSPQECWTSCATRG
jgi:acyl-coenzyme A synthetase/AMP-(fatty) acid ligase